MVKYTQRLRDVLARSIASAKHQDRGFVSADHVLLAILDAPTDIVEENQTSGEAIVVEGDPRTYPDEAGCE